jgi:hypothetical protein
MTSDNRLLEEITDLLARLDAVTASPEGAVVPDTHETHTSTDPPHQHERQEMNGPDILHIFIIDEPADESETLAEDTVVESTLHPAQETDDEPVTEPLHKTSTDNLFPLPPSSSHAHSSRRHMMWVGLACCVLLPLVIIIVSVWQSWAPTATVTLLPASATLTTTTTVQVMAAGAANAIHQQQIPGRLLPSLTLTQARTLATTGVGTQPAQVAHGSITFYNAAPNGQTIPTGTLLTGNDGVQVVTEQDAVLPAAAFPTDGQVTVAAHAVSIGPAGNIGPRDIYGACCRENVFAVNTVAFTGGQLARTFRMVTARDIAGTVALLKASLAHSVQAAFAAQVAPTEILITPVACVPAVTTSHAAGDEAARVQVMLTETCSGATYTTHALQTLLTERMNRQALAQLGTGYILVGNVQTSLLQTQATHSTQGIARVQVTGEGTWVYQFTQAQVEHLATLIAGKTVAQATSLLLQETGVQTVSFVVTGHDTAMLPINPQDIHMLAVYAE